MKHHPETPQHWIALLDQDDQRLTIVQALEAEGGCCTRAARRLEMSRMSFWRHLRDANMLSVPTQVRERQANRFRLTG